MTYKEITEKYKETSFGDVGVVLTENYVRDSIGSLNQDGWEWQIELPHSCDEWVIGNATEAEIMSANLLKAVKYIEDNPIIN